MSISIIIINSNKHKLNFKLKVKYNFFDPTRAIFTHLETSLFPVKGYKFWPILGTPGHLAVRVSLSATPTLTQL